MKRFTVTGMTCAACQARVEKAVTKVSGVESAAVSLLTNSMTVEGSVSDSEIIRAVEAAGYGAFSKDNASRRTAADEDALADHESPKLLKRLIISLIFLLPLMYLSMGHSMHGMELPAFFSGDPAAAGIAQLLLAAVIMVINRKFFISGFRGILHGSPNMDTLVALGSSASFVWSVYALFMLTDAQVKYGTAEAMKWTGEFYFESAAMILVLITVGKLLEAGSKGRTTDALRSLMKLAPETAVVIRDGTEVTVPAEEIQTGDIFAVKPGAAIPADGIITEGSTAVDESALTGESIPADKTVGDSVSAASLNSSGYILCKATRVGEDTTLSQIIRMVSDAAATKAPIARTADKVSGVFVPAVVGISLVTLIIWLILGRAFDFALARAISVLVISCPCALGLATPVAVMVGSGVGAKNGILFKTAVSLEEAGKMQIAVLDKTGTVTNGKPEVTEIIPADGVTEEELLSAAYSLEIKSEHPLAGAVVNEAEHRGMKPCETTDFTAYAGCGASAMLGGKMLYGGSLSFISQKMQVDRSAADGLSDKGCTPLLFALDGKYLGIIAAADKVKDDSAAAVAELKAMGVETVMLTGDNIRTAKAVSRQAGIENVVAGVLPDGKQAVVSRLKELGRTAMVGDGINDAPALTAADIGIAIGAGTDAAIDAADIVLMNSRLSDVTATVKLSRRTLKNIRENLFWAFFYNILCIPLAAGCYTGLFGWTLSPMIAAAAMSLSSICVVMNALRLNLFDAHSSKHRRTSVKRTDSELLKQVIEDINKSSEVKSMKKTIRIEGMMCGHCEAHTKKALEAIDGVESAEASHINGNAVVTLSKSVDDSVLKAAVEEEGYTVLGIE